MVHACGAVVRLSCNTVSLLHVKAYPGTLTPALRCDHPRARSHDACVLRVHAHHETRLVHERDHGQVEGIAQAP